MAKAYVLVLDDLGLDGEPWLPAQREDLGVPQDPLARPGELLDDAVGRAPGDVQDGRLHDVHEAQ
ncbi:hypothetical protein GCM10009546_57160 [Actinomadura livida]|uniref:Uncharacterized protein n=1 Tax=Actinomadura livida TaxID=79909 RepID=A0A7W7IKG9_9ACTN|nr:MULTISPECIES: hypothetical protein [Actinomadura]MBB4778576.1 hypothetical protein [Actinomadura catellatispora]GGU29964.1 hypothetical protein GCM10010208_63390 [Actinomadura livida]